MYSVDEEVNDNFDKSDDGDTRDEVRTTKSSVMMSDAYRLAVVITWALMALISSAEQTC